MRLPNYESFNNILLIEDNPGDARLVEILLEESDLYDCEIVNKTTLSEGMEALEESSFSAVLLDLTLPDSRGFETLERLMSRFPDANVIVMTGLAAKEVGIRAVKTGAQDFLVKGEFDSDQLAKALRYSIERNSVLKRLEEAQRIAHIGNWDFNLSTRQFEVSEEVYRIFGYALNELVIDSKRLRSSIHPDDIEAVAAVYHAGLANQATQQDLRIIRSDGEVRYISVQITPQTAKSATQKSIHKISGIVQDITERRSAENELFKSRERYQIIFSQSKDAIYISTGLRLVDFNTAMGELFGYSKEELLELDVYKLYKNVEDKERFNRIMETSNFVKDFEVELVQKDGTAKFCLITANRVVTEGFKGYHGIIRDITERKQGDELRKAKELAETSAKMKEQFLANVSHEMRTPMNAILGLTNLLLKTDFDKEQENYLISIRESSQHLLGIINDILEISSLKEGKISFEEKEFNLPDLITNLVHFVDYKIKEKGLTLKVEIEETIEPCLLGDQLRLQQILTNLLANAVKFTEEGFVKLGVEKVNETGDTVHLKFCITDTGIGIAEDKLEVIFETFTRVFDRKMKEYGGTGLGLAIVKQLVQLQGGSVQVESQLGRGSVFSCILPFKKSKKENIVKPMEEEVVVLMDTEREIHILLVEDHKLNQIVARKTLEKEWQNVVVTIADNGQIAIDKLRENNFDLILMDIQMPVMDGYQATQYIRENFEPEKANIPIFAMTAHAHMAQDEKFKEFGMDDCVLKPFEPKTLFSKIAKHINNKPAPSMNSKNNDTKNGEKVIDLSYMDLMADGDDDMKKVMLELLFVEPVEEIKSMYQFVNKQDWNSLKKVSHKMKSTLAFVGNPTLTETNKEIEKIAMTSESTEKLPQLVETLDNLYQKALVELKEEHAKL